MKASLIVALVFVLAAMAGPQADTASIQGRILRAGTNEPIAGVRVTGENSESRAQVTATTSAAGTFTLTGLAPGAYRLAFVARGYVDQVYGRKSETGPWTPIEIAAGQAVKDLVVRLTPTGSREGRVRDSNGLPAVGAPIALLRSTYDAEGKKTLSSVVTTDTDDRGEYRIFWITPGRYYLRAGGRVPMSFQLSGRTTDGTEMNPFAETFYPGVASSESATPIEILAGSDVQGMNFLVKPQRLLRIRGRVIDVQTGRFPPDADIGIIGEGWSGSGGDRYDETNGTFEVGDLWPGAFQVAAALRDTAQVSALTAGGGRRVMPASEFAAVRLIDQDVDDVVLRILPLVSLGGRVFIDGNTSPPQGLSVRLQSLDGRSRAPLPNTAIGLVNADGSFEMPQVVGGNYQVGVSDPAFYVKQARYGGSDVLKEPLKVGGVASATLEITLSRNFAQISGTITDKLMQRVSGVRVVLVPEVGRHRRDLFKETTTDPVGRYSFTSVPPGDYRVYAWEAIDARAWFDPRLLRRSRISLPLKASSAHPRLLFPPAYPENTALPAHPKREIQHNAPDATRKTRFRNRRILLTGLLKLLSSEALDALIAAAMPP